MSDWSTWKSASDTPLPSRRLEYFLYGKDATEPAELQASLATVVLAAVKESVAPSEMGEVLNVGTDEILGQYAALRDLLPLRVNRLMQNDARETQDLLEMQARLEDLADDGNASALSTLHSHLHTQAGLKFPALRVGLLPPSALSELLTSR